MIEQQQYVLWSVTFPGKPYLPGVWGGEPIFPVRSDSQLVFFSRKRLEKNLRCSTAPPERLGDPGKRYVPVQLKRTELLNL